MGLDIPLNIIIAYALGLILLYIVGWLLLVPLKMIFKFIFNGVIGGVILWVLNIIGGFVGVTVAINPITALLVGFLGVPGVILVLLLHFILV